MTPTSPRGKRFSCPYLRWHDWQTISNPDESRYRACCVCDWDEPTYDDGWYGIAGGLG